MGRGERRSLRMAMIFLGPPGAGKGTQSRQLSQRWSLPQISTGDILRKAVKAQTPLGRAAQAKMDAGELVPDEVVCGLVEERIREPDSKRGFILDGFPRTLGQAERIDEILQAAGKSRIRVLNLKVDESTLLKRQTGRRTCEVCGEIYNIHFSPSKNEGICDKDGEKLVQRADDEEEAARRRQTAYREKTEPLIKYYQARKLLEDVEGNQKPNQISEEIIARLKPL